MSADIGHRWRRLEIQVTLQEQLWPAEVRQVLQSRHLSGCMSVRPSSTDAEPPRLSGALNCIAKWTGASVHIGCDSADFSAIGADDICLSLLLLGKCSEYAQSCGRRVIDTLDDS